jgi:hypothetical protein
VAAAKSGGSGGRLLSTEGNHGRGLNRFFTRGWQRWVIWNNFRGSLKLDGRPREKPFCFYY